MKLQAGGKPSHALSDALETEGLSKQYRRERWALRDVDLRVPRGGITALIGPNAAGKSTLIRSWIGFERPTSGVARVRGWDSARHTSQALAHVGYVPQTPVLYDTLTVDDHLELARHLRPRFDRTAARQRLVQLGVPTRASGRDLSGGQQAQVALSIALGTRAAILLLDEPLASLDPLARREFLHVVKEAAAADGTTILLSSHIVTDVEQVCDSLIVLGGGRVLLHSSIPDARAQHVVAEGQSHGPVVGRFTDPMGRELVLVRASGHPSARSRRPTLEEVVLGHLAAGRENLAAGTAV